MRAFLQQAGDILEIAANGDGSLQDMAILIDRQGGMRMLDSSGWSLPALSAEFGAIAVYKVERRGTSVRVEGWDGCQRCLVQRNSQPHFRALISARSIALIFANSPSQKPCDCMLSR